MTGLYIHIPFCQSRCIYCGFYSTTGLHLRQQYVDALCKEMEMRQDEAKKRNNIGTIYLGGGTPSQLSVEQLEQLFYYIYKVYGTENTTEITMECNPDDVTTELTEAIGRLPINRVSMGAQTFDDQRLRFLHRRHTADEIGRAVERLRKVGIRNISIDLMYGFPDETLAQWQQDIGQALKLNVEHLSAYSLMYEEGTPLYRLLENGNVNETDEEVSRQMYEELIDRLTAAGYEHYEISNFSRQGFHSRHNSNYWNQTPYIGLGAAAHSYDGASCRRWNIDDVKKYIEGIENRRPDFEQEALDADTRYNDLVMTALRTRKGLDLSLLSPEQVNYCKTQALRYEKDGLLVFEDQHLRLTRRGLFVSNMIMSDLMKV